MKDFVCIGGKCEESCCIGWTIPIDASTYKKYQRVKDEAFRRRLHKELVPKRQGATSDYVAKIKLKNNRCAFLDPEGWCSIYKVLGENYLSTTCTLYPRTINEVKGVLEYSLVCSCPEAARKILLQEEPITWEETQDASSVVVISGCVPLEGKKKDLLHDYLEEIRVTFWSILQNRNEDFESRLLRFQQFIKELDDLNQQRNYLKLKALFEKTEASLKHPLKVGAIGGATKSKEKLGKLQALRELKDVKLKSKRYEILLNEILKAFYGDNENVRALIRRYEVGEQQYRDTFLKTKGYLLENYFVNYIYERCVPLDQERPQASFHILKLYYDVLKLHLIGLLLGGKELNDEQVIYLIQSFSKTFDHGELEIRYFER